MSYNRPRVGWKGVLQAYPKLNWKESLRVPICLTLCILIISYLYDCWYPELHVSKKIASFLIENSLKAYPLGLSLILAGIALFISMVSQMEEFFRRNSKDHSEPTYFQQVTSTFCIIAAILVVGIVVSSLSSLLFGFYDKNETTPCGLVYSEDEAVPLWLVYSVLGCVSFVSIYTIKAILDIVINIFNCGQILQLGNDKKNGII